MQVSFRVVSFAVWQLRHEQQLCELYSHASRCLAGVASFWLLASHVLRYGSLLSATLPAPTRLWRRLRLPQHPIQEGAYGSEFPTDFAVAAHRQLA